jgi:hypothetical protein
METINRRPIGVGRPDDWSTPDYATDLIIPYIPKDVFHIWEPCAGKGKMVDRLVNAGFNVIGTDIMGGVDFLTTELGDDEYECTITNPPYSKKTDFIRKCYESGKPWAMLMPLTTLEGLERTQLFTKYGIKVLIPSRRIKFERFGWIERNSSPQYQTAWFCSHHFTLPQQLNFVDVKIPTKPKKKKEQ